MSVKATQTFQALEVSLDQKNLIEASAGTGKTYSIALLVLRLLLETHSNKGKPLRIDQILMVTFTKYAVAELQTRIRQFIRMALKICENGGSVEEKAIAAIVEKSIKTNGKEETLKILQNAVIMMDETSIMTIHSFCQEILTEFAFDTEQTFGAKAISGSDYQQLIRKAAQHFWRTKITTLSLPVLQRIKPFLSIDTLVEMSEKTIAGKKLWIKAEAGEVLSEQEQQQFVSDCVQSEAEMDAITKRQLAFLEINGTQLKDICSKNTAAKKWNNDNPGIFERPQELLGMILKSASRGKYVYTIFPEVMSDEEQKAEHQKKIRTLISNYHNRLLQLALQAIQTEVAVRKNENGWISFDDMIIKVRDAVTSSEKLCALIRNKYKAVFIDEFQDTDSLQYEIFNRLFHKETILYYIGDPKQSIYAFRKADMNTYFKAKNEGVDRILEMNTNYRSTASVIQALNLFFKPTPVFDTFHFSGSTDSIEYIQVQSPSGSEKQTFQLNGSVVSPLSIISGLPNKDALHDATASQVAELLRNNYEICNDGTKQKLQPSDIGILVSTNYEARKIKSKLAAYKIPAVTLEDDKVLESLQAKELYYVLHAVISMEKDKIRKALLTEFTGLNMQDILLLNEEIILERFKVYQQILFTPGKGVYVMLMLYANDHQLRERMLDLDCENGERKLSNWTQLMELLNSVENKKQLSPHELLSWLGKVIEGNEIEGDEYVQRIDNDETAVKIITVHKSKGLEYKVVLAPNLDLDTASKTHISTEEFRSEIDGQYYFEQRGMLTDECETWREKQAEQENRRLLYVALTRAKYKCYVFSYNKKGTSTVKNFISAISENKPAGIEDWIVWEEPSVLTPAIYRYRSANISVNPQYEKADHFSLLDTSWKKMSYSALNPPHAITTIPSEKSLVQTEYDRFIFEQLKKGAHTGNLLHYIFEQADFTNESHWEKTIFKAARRLGTVVDEKMSEGLIQMMRQVLQVSLPDPLGAFSLNSVADSQKINELEFDFPVQLLSAKTLQQLSPEKTPWQLQPEETLQGIMNGKMDLFFENRGRYYLLDWKSNHLGYSTEDYTKDKVGDAMLVNNYHLQYHLYIVAICLYLRWRLPEFDYDKHFGGVIYLFVRGVRAGENTGIFYHKPESELIETLLKLFEG